MSTIPSSTAQSPLTYTSNLTNINNCHIFHATPYTPNVLLGSIPFVEGNFLPRVGVRSRSLYLLLSSQELRTTSDFSLAFNLLFPSYNSSSLRLCSLASSLFKVRFEMERFLYLLAPLVQVTHCDWPKD